MCPVEMSPQGVARILDLAARHGVEILRAPRTGLEMMRFQDARLVPFFLGEVLVTEVEVGMGEARGYAMVLGDRPDQALARACADLFLRTGREALQQETSALLQDETGKAAARRRREEELIARTRVNFDLMPGNG
jgi:phosphonate C-P lyase system protein PhnG